MSDLGHINFMLEDAKQLIANNQLEAAKAMLINMERFFQDAEIDGVPAGMVMRRIDEGRELLAWLERGLEPPKSLSPVKAMWMQIVRRLTT